MAKAKLAYSLEENVPDEELVSLAKNGDKESLNIILTRYKDLVNMKVSKYFIIGAEKEDIVQEGMIGLYKAVQSFDEKKDSAFKSFANLCIERQLITAIKTSNRQKHIPLNNSVSLNTNVYADEDETTFIDLFNSKTVEDPLDILTKKESYKIIGARINKYLSSFEKQVLNRYAKGESYVKIAEKLDAPIKSVDNAIQRIRKKASKNIITEDED